MPSIYILNYDSDIANVLCEWFNQNGFNTKGFTTAEQLLKALETNPPDLIILDSLNGHLSATVDICHSIRSLLHYPGEIFLTSTGLFSKADMQACNVSACIAKPFELSEVLNIVKNPIKNSVPKRE